MFFTKRIYGVDRLHVIPCQRTPQSLPVGMRWAVEDSDFFHPDRRVVKLDNGAVDVAVPVS